MGCFQLKNPFDLRHIVAKMEFRACFTKGYPTDIPHYQGVLIFAYLRATDFALENNRFSVLKNGRRGRFSGW